MNKCLQCGVDIESYTGRRPKKFCSDGCRATYHKKPRPKKNVTRGTFEKVVKEKAELAMELAKFKANHVGEASGHKIDIKTPIEPEETKRQPFMTDAIKKKLGIK